MRSEATVGSITDRSDPHHAEIEQRRVEISNGLPQQFERGAVSPDVERTDPEGVDYGWVMQVTFVASIVVGAPIVAIASLFVTLPSWPDRAIFAIRVGAPVWLLISLSVYGYARSHQDEAGMADER